MGASAQPKERVDQRRSIQTKARILDAAEELFSLHGFSGTSLRDIHALSGVRISLCYYHFGSKEDVLQAVVDRRAQEHRQALLDSLQACLAEAEQSAVSVEQLVAAYARPVIEGHLTRGEGWRNYTRLMAHLASESAHLEPRVQLNKYDPVIDAFVEQFRKSLPGSTEAQIHWGFYFLRASLINLLLDTQIVDHQSRGLCDSTDVDVVIQQAQQFFAAGFHHPMP